MWTTGSSFSVYGLGYSFLLHVWSILPSSIVNIAILFLPLEETIQNIPVLFHFINIEYSYYHLITLSLYPFILVVIIVLVFDLGMISIGVSLDLGGAAVKIFLIRLS